MSSRDFFRQVVRDNAKYINDVVHAFPPQKSIVARNAKNLQCVLPESPPYPEVQVLFMDTLDAAQKIQQECKGERPLVLNMASERTPGGGYLNGALAQEESLFYRTTLSHVIPTHHYPLDDYTVIYSPRVVVFRDSRYNVLKYDQCFDVDIVSMAAVRYKTPEDNHIMAQKIHGLCRAAKNLKYEVLLLGAFGCGAFHNDPRIVSALFKHILPQYGFKKIYFAIVGDNDNYGVFRSAFQK